MTIEKDGETIELVVAAGRDPEMVKGSALLSLRDIEHEARVLECAPGPRAARPEGLRLTTPTSRFILMERLAGTNRLADAPDDDTRRQIMFEYYDELAAAAQPRRGVDAPVGHRDPEDARGDRFSGSSSFADDDYRENRAKLRPEPLLDLGVWWLHANVPQERSARSRSSRAIPVLGSSCSPTAT